MLRISNDIAIFFPVIDTMLVPGSKDWNGKHLKEEREIRRAIMRETYSSSSKVATLSYPLGSDPIDIVQDGN